MSSLTLNSSSAFCSLLERLEYFGRFNFLITASISFSVAYRNVSTVWWFFRGIQDLLGFSEVYSEACETSTIEHFLKIVTTRSRYLFW